MVFRVQRNATEGVFYKNAVCVAFRVQRNATEGVRNKIAVMPIHAWSSSSGAHGFHLLSQECAGSGGASRSPVDRYLEIPLPRRIQSANLDGAMQLLHPNFPLVHREAEIVSYA